MKRAAIIKKQSTPLVRQPINRKQSAGTKAAPRVLEKDVLITSNLREILNEVAVDTGVGREVIAADAVRIYLQFARQYTDLAQAQPAVHFPDALLWIRDRCPVAKGLADAAAFLDSDPSSIAEAALSVYTTLLRSSTRDARLRDARLIDVENIRYELSRANEGAKQAALNTVMNALNNHKFPDAAEELGEARELIMLHPGLRETSRALTMMLNGYWQLCDGELKSVPWKGGAK